MSKHKRSEWLLGLSIIGILFIFFCISTFDFPKKVTPTETPWPTLDARTVDLKNSLLSSDDFPDDCCADVAQVRLGKQHDGLPNQEFISHLGYGRHEFDDIGKPIRIYTYEIIDHHRDDYFPEGYLIAFIYANANEAQKNYAGSQELPYFDKAYFYDGGSYDWAAGWFLRCRIIGEIYIEGFSKDNLIYLSHDVSSRMGYLC
jgi:hypothetical protein